VAQHLGHC